MTAPAVVPAELGGPLSSLELSRDGLLSFTQQFGGPHGLMRWASMAAGAPAVPPALFAIAESAEKGEPISFELAVGPNRFRFDFR